MSPVEVPPDEMQWRFTGSGGPGGQHANTSNTRVELVWDVATSEAVSEAQRALITERLGSPIRIVASGERSQTRNRELAIERLHERITAALHVDPPRRPTRPTHGSNERRLEDKRRRAARKQGRREDD